MGQPINLLGRRFGKLVVQAKDPVRSSNGGVKWVCLCDCGNTASIRGDALTSAGTSSCGCIRVDSFRDMATSHGLRRSPEYNSWHSAKQRCTNPNAKQYKNYGGRGIQFCDHWMSFENFYLDMGKRPSPQHSVERKDNNGNYEPGNCVWASKKEQANNTSKNVFYEYRGSKYSIAQLWEISQSIGSCVALPTIFSRIHSLGWSVERSVEEPALKQRTYTHNGVTKTISQWASEYGVDIVNLRNRLLNLNWDFERAISTK